MTAAKVWQWHAVLHGRFRQAKGVNKKCVSVGTCDAVERIKPDLERASRQERLDQTEIENLAQILDVVFD